MSHVLLYILLVKRLVGHVSNQNWAHDVQEIKKRRIFIKIYVFFKRNIHGVVDDQQNQRRQNGRENSQGSEQLGLLLRITPTLRFTDSLKSGLVWCFLYDSRLSLALFMLFALTPRPITFVATIIAGVVVPCMRSAAALEADGEADKTGLQRHNWLAYWSVYSLLDLVYTMFECPVPAANTEFSA